MGQAGKALSWQALLDEHRLRGRRPEQFNRTADKEQKAQQYAPEEPCVSPITTKPTRVRMFMPKRMSLVSTALARGRDTPAEENSLVCPRGLAAAGFE